MAKNFSGGLLARILDRPLLATPAMARFYLGYLAKRDNLDGLLLEAGAETSLRELTAVGKYEYRDGKSFASVRDSGIAVLEVYGSLAHKYGTIGPSSGMTGYDGLERQLADAVKDPSVRGILLDVHSHGGEVSGCFDLADKIYAARSVKPLWAVADEVAYSAAYALASQADRLVTTRTGGVGSVGVVLMHGDYSQQLAQDGIKVTLIHAGAHKVDGNPFEPLPEDVRTELQAEVDASYRMFTALVARGSGIPEADVIATQARCFVPDDAMSVGFIDDIQAASEVFDEFAEFLASARTVYPAATAASSKEGAMAPRNSKLNAPPPADDPEDDKDEEDEDAEGGPTTPAAAAKAFARKNPAAAALLRADGATAERERMTAIDEIAEPGEEVLAAKFKAEGVNVEKAARGFAADRKAGREAAAAARAAETPKPLAQTPTDPTSGAAPAADAPQTDEQLEAAFDKDAKLKAEFGTFERYAAYQRAMAAGNVRILSKANAA